MEELAEKEEKIEKMLRKGKVKFADVLRIMNYIANGDMEYLVKLINFDEDDKKD